MCKRWDTPEQRTRLVPSDKCAASWGSEDAAMRMITASFVRVLLRYTDVLCTHSMFTWQQVRTGARMGAASILAVALPSAFCPRMDPALNTSDRDATSWGAIQIPG